MWKPNQRMKKNKRGKVVPHEKLESDKKDQKEMSDQKYYTSKQVAKRYGVNQETVRRWCRSRDLEHLKLSDRSVRIRSDQLEKFEKSRSISEDHDT